MKKIINQIKKFIKSLILKISSWHKDIHYINGPEVLPPPLTKKEENQIMEKILSGEPNSVREPLDRKSVV